MPKHDGLCCGESGPGRRGADLVDSTRASNGFPQEAGCAIGFVQHVHPAQAGMMHYSNMQYPHPAIPAIRVFMSPQARYQANVSKAAATKEPEISCPPFFNLFLAKKRNSILSASICPLPTLIVYNPSGDSRLLRNCLL